MNNKPPRGITLVILVLWALLCLRCEETKPCDKDDALRCKDDALEHCVNGEWEVIMDCKELIGEDAQCQDTHNAEAKCVIIGG